MYGSLAARNRQAAGHTIFTRILQYAQQYAQQYAKEYAQENERQVAKRMLSDGIPVDTILRYSTLLSRQDIEHIQEAKDA